MEWLAALGVAFGATYGIAMPLRTVRYPKLFWSTFVTTYAATVAALYFFPLPNDMLILFGSAGALLGIALMMIRRKTVELEEDYEATRRARGEKIYR